MNDLVPTAPLPVPNPDRERWEDALELVGLWLAETKGNTRTTYADAIGWPRYLTTVPDRKDKRGQVTTKGHHAGDSRDTSTLRNGVTWLLWCARNGIHLLDADRTAVVAWTEALRATPHPKTGELLDHATRGHTFTAASSFYTWAMKAGHTLTNPMVLVDRRKLGVDIPKVDSPTRSLTRREIAKLQLAADSDPVESVRLRSSALVAVLYRLGLRVSELCNMRTDNLERTGGVRVVWVKLKGDRPHPYKIPAEARTRLERYLTSRGIGNVVAVRGQHGGTSAPMFATASGGKMDRSEVGKLLQRLAGYADINDPGTVTPHTARHSLSTALREEGVADEKIQRLFGHKQAETTARYGKHVLELMNSPSDVADEVFEQEMQALALGTNR